MKYESIVEAVAHHANNTPHKICVCEDDKTCTYKELWEMIRRFAERIKSEGLETGDRVVVKASQTIDYLVASFAVHLAGGVLVPTEKNATDQYVIDLVELSDAVLLIAPKDAGYSCKFINISNIHTAATNTKTEKESPVFPKSSAMADILFTTGTTGKAKGVMLNFTAQVATAANIVGFTKIEADDVVMVPLPLSHAGGTRRTYATLYAGATVVLQNGVVYVGKFFRALEEYQVTIIFLVPTFLSLLLDSAAKEFNKFARQIKAISIASAVTPEADKKLLCELLPYTNLYIAYGGTEAGNSSCINYSEYPEKAHCVGIESKYAKISFVDMDGNVMNDTSYENPGILACEGPNVMMGYWKDPELTASVLKGGKVILADMGYRGEDGMIYLLGRRDDVINTGGNKVAPYEIEELVMCLPEVFECACVPVPDRIMGSVPKLYVVLKDNEVFSYKRIYNFLATRLENFKLPRYIEQIDALPRTNGLGKIMINELKKRR